MLPIQIVTSKPVAFDSPDHLVPHGTANDNSTNPAFNQKLLRWLAGSSLRVLDLGCSGGGFVKSLLDQGHFAVGVEGSDYSKARRRAEWATIPGHLFTADITEPFEILGTGQEAGTLQFDVVTAWEVIEHIPTEKLAIVFENISRHLSPHGVVIMSVSTSEEVIQGVKLHLTVRDRSWWLNRFRELGFRHHNRLLQYFGADWVRGGANAPSSFHVVLTRAHEDLPSSVRLNLLIPGVKLRALGTWPLRIARRLARNVPGKSLARRIVPQFVRTRVRRMFDAMPND